MNRLLAVLSILLSGCQLPYWGGANQGYGYPGEYGYGYPGYGRYGYGGFGGFGYPGYGYYGPGYGYNSYGRGYNQAREEDWRRWQAYQYGLDQGRQQAGKADRDTYQPRRPASPGPSLPYGITRNRSGTYHVPGYGDYTAGQIQNYMRKKRR